MSTAIHTGRSSHHVPDPATGCGMPAASASAVAPNIAVRCHRNAVIARPFAVTTPRQTPGRASQRDTGARTSSTRPISQTEHTARANVGGDMFDTGSPGMPTIEVGYGPAVVNAIVPARPAPISTSGRRRRDPSRPSAYRNPTWCTPSHTIARFRKPTNGTSYAKRATSTAPAASPSATGTAGANRPHRSCNRSIAGASATTPR